MKRKRITEIKRALVIFLNWTNGKTTPYHLLYPNKTPDPLPTEKPYPDLYPRSSLRSYMYLPFKPASNCQETQTNSPDYIKRTSRNQHNHQFGLKLCLIYFPQNQMAQTLAMADHDTMIR